MCSRGATTGATLLPPLHVYSILPPGNTDQLEHYLTQQLQANSLDVETHSRLIELLSARAATDDALHYCCRLSPLFYQELQLLQLSFSVMCRYLTNNKVEYHMAEHMLKTCDWVMGAVTKQKRELAECRASWVNYDNCLYELSHNLNFKDLPQWEVLTRECVACLWLYLPCLLTG